MRPDPPAFSPTGDEPERRQWPRNPAGEIIATFIPEPQPAPPFVAVENLSPGGIRLLLYRRYDVGTALHMRLQRPGRNLVCVVAGKVVYVVEERAGLFITGCDFDRQLSDDELRGLL
ncbi:MAG TPA: PilZ domain-containing protein [Gemmataceae bacterium]|nr:PilZ domain-containing protein [Gemmataceae bacterium]